MQLSHLKDNELLSHGHQLVQNERLVLTEILHHLREVERRRFFCDLGYGSLFEYTVKELKYSEGQAGRRLQAMKLLKELPELEEKIENGSLNLSNISQAQSFFRESKKADRELDKEEKLKVMDDLENKTAREGQKIIFGIDPEIHMPKERERMVSETQTEVRFLMSENLRVQLEEVRSLLGYQGAQMSFAELFAVLAGLTKCC